ncbi:YjcG family protein [Neobacillus massiliamazoniensis]|uniref:Putative phosphoesterase BN000_03404 n=1 Tax=Neobacillus massiliamazoniensis TaxID=1499688 RepID=A0A0U1NZK4_9BACI|nr:YjcG family protein [Neobacillus massiliamazoniensis]CRK83435.1 YjcG [Neobacillus massiliamazoniensis]
MKFGVIIFPSKKLQDLANSYRKRYDPHYALIPPHITLKYAFEATEDEALQFAEKLRHIAGNSHPFLLKTSKISSFSPVNNVIYFKVEPTEELTYLHAEINKEFNQQNTEYAFVPHITIGQHLSNVEHSDVYGSLRMTNVDHEETVDRFHLLYQLENGSWTVYETFRLGRE